MSNFARSTAARRGSSNNKGNYAPRSNAAVRIDEYHIKGPGSNPKEDFVKGVLLSPIGTGADRIEPTYQYLREDGKGGWLECAPEEATRFEPNLEVTVRLNPELTTRRQRDLATMRKGKGMVASAPEGSQTVFEKTKIVSTSPLVLEADYVAPTVTPENRGVVGKDASGLEIVDPTKITQQLFSGMYISVLPERRYKSEKTDSWEPAGRQNVLVADPQSTRPVSSDEELHAQVSEILANSVYGTPGVILLARKLAPEGMSDEDAVAFASSTEDYTRFGAMSIATPKRENDAWVPLTEEEVIANLWKGAGEMTKVWGNPDWQFEAIPLINVSQAKSLVPSLPENEKKIDNSEITALFGFEDRQNGIWVRNPVTLEDGRVMGMVGIPGFASGHLVLRMNEAQTYWMTTYQSTLGQGTPTLEVHDLITPLMPAYHVAACEATAERLGADKALYYRTKSAQKQAAEAAAAPAQEGAAPAAPAPSARR